jgi:hypothetical protein
MVDGKVVEVTGPSDSANKSPLDFSRSTVLGFSSTQIPTWHKAAPRHDSNGQAVFHSLREVREFEARSKDMGEEWSYNEV